MKKAMCMIAIAAISFGTVYAAPYQQDTTKTKVKTKTSKSKTKTKGDSTKTKVKTKTPTPNLVYQQKRRRVFTGGVFVIALYWRLLRAFEY